MKLRARLGWTLFGVALLYAGRICVVAALGRPGRLVDCDALRRRAAL